MAEVNFAGLKGKKFMAGLAMGRYAAKQDLKKFIRAEHHMEDAFDDSSKSIRKHNIEKVEKKQKIVLEEAKEMATEGYALSFDLFLLIKRSFTRLADAAQKHKRNMSPPLKQTLRAFARKEMDSMQETHREINGLLKRAKGESSIAMTVKIGVRGKMSLLQYLTIWNQIRGAFKDEKKLEPLYDKLKKGKLTKDDLETLKKKEMDMIKRVKKALTWDYVIFAKGIETLIKNDEIMQQAAGQHEIPQMMFIAERKGFENDRQRIIAMLHSFQTMANQIVGYARDVSKLV